MGHLDTENTGRLSDKQTLAIPIVAVSPSVAAGAKAAGISRSTLNRWLLDPASDGVTGRRFLGVRWDPSLPPEEAAETASAPAAWSGLGQQARWPGQDRGE